MKTTLTAKELGLRFTVASINESTFRAPLAGFARVNHNYRTASRFSLILDEALELSKAPRVQPSASFPMIDLDPVSDISEVFQDDCSPRCNTLDNRGGDNMIAIPSEFLFTSSEASKMPFGTLGTIGLQCTFKAKDTFNHFFLMTIPMKAVIRADRRASDSQIYTDSLAVGNKLNIGQADNDVEIKPALSLNQVGGSSFTTDSIGGIRGEGESNLHSATGSRKVHQLALPINLEGMKIIPGRTNWGLRTSNSSPLFNESQSRFNRFGSLLPYLYMQIRNQCRQSILAITISQFMQGIGITCSLLITYFANHVKRLGKLRYSFMQGLRLLICWFELDSDCSIHINSLPYTRGILQMQRRLRANSPAT